MADLSEQVGEAAHYSMASVLQRHKVAEDHLTHGERQLAAVVKFSSWNVYNMTGNIKSRKRLKIE